MKRSAVSGQRSAVSGDPFPVRGSQFAVGINREPRTENREPLEASFTLIELLAVIGIIILLAGMILGTATYANRKSLESKTKSQLHQLTLALELFKTDNGYYPITISNSPPSTYAPTMAHAMDQGTTNNMWTLYTAVTGCSITNAPPNKPDVGTSYYQEIRPDQIQAASGTNYLVDPYGNVWGYFNTTNSVPGWTTNQFNSRSYDLWSFGLTTTDPTNSLIANWRKQ